MKPALRLVAPSPASVSTADRDALDRVARGDVGALGEVYDRYARALFSFVQRMAPREDADDIVQSVFVRVVSIAHTYRPDATSAKPWLFGIGVRVIQERRRSLRRMVSFLTKLSASERTSSPGPSADRTDLDRALERISPPKREALWLAEVEGMTANEIATVQGVAVGTIWTRLHHARRELREILEGKR